MTDSNDLRAIGFEDFKRKNPYITKLASAWRGTPEYESWMNIYTQDDNTTVEYFEEEDHQIGTFYRKLSEAEIEKLTAMETKEVVPEGPKHYEVLSVVHEHSDERETHCVTHVRLGVPRWVRIGDRFGLCEYVLVDQYRANVSDDAGSFVHMNTRVSVTDENVAEYEDAEPIYVAPAVLDVFEVMFAIGEVGEYNGDSVS